MFGKRGLSVHEAQEWSSAQQKFRGWPSVLFSESLKLSLFLPNFHLQLLNHVSCGQSFQQVDLRCSAIHARQKKKVAKGSSRRISRANFAGSSHRKVRAQSRNFNSSKWHSVNQQRKKTLSTLETLRLRLFLCLDHLYTTSQSESIRGQAPPLSYT